MAEAESASAAGSATGGIKPVYAPTFTDCMEQLQQAYVGSIAASAGVTMEVIARDHRGVDVEFIQPRGDDEEEISIYAQLKNTTTVRPDPQRAAFSYRLKKRRYFKQLAKPRKMIKAILIVMVTDPDQTMWASASHDQLTIVNCCYWVSLESLPVPDATQPIVRVPTANVFDSQALRAMLERVERGEAI